MKDEFERTALQPADLSAALPVPQKPPVLTLDVSLYEDFFENSDLTDQQKREFLEALWSIIVGFVDLGFGIHPVQLALEAASQEPEADSLIQYHQKEEEKQSLYAISARRLAGKED